MVADLIMFLSIVYYYRILRVHLFTIVSAELEKKKKEWMDHPAVKDGTLMVSTRFIIEFVFIECDTTYYGCIGIPEK